MFIFFYSEGIALWTPSHKGEQQSGKKHIWCNTLLTGKEIGFYLSWKRSQILLLNGLKYAYLIRCEPKIKGCVFFFLIPGPQQVCNNVFFLEFPHLVTLNFYCNFDILFFHIRFPPCYMDNIHIFKHRNLYVGSRVIYIWCKFLEAIYIRPLKCIKPILNGECR